MKSGTRARLAKLEARQAALRGVVIVWPDGLRDAYGNPAQMTGAAYVVRLPARALTPGEVQAARGRA
ncbi:hypothetical protein [Deinococcus arcticus]|uniref:hypothetical protein n=1 Tax=Deinococcus arcticus TaxID=2136176 RepID=UPI0011B21ED9|nr:hypothetical protein [Deinococcus arcticus]